MDIDTAVEKMNAVQRTLKQQQKHLDCLWQALKSAATAQAAETVPATPSTGVPTHYSSKPSWPAPPGFEWVLEEGVGTWTLGKVQGQQERGQETVPPSEAGTKGPKIDMQAWGKRKQELREAYLRGFEAAKALLLAVKPEPERGPDNFLWVNVYRDEEGGYRFGSSHETKTGANEEAVGGRVARARVWFNEGQYDD